MLKGLKGVQYGLTVPNSKKKQAVARPNALAAFGDEDSDGEHEAVPQQLARQAASKKSDSKVAEMHAAALAEDPSAFDYDGVYESMAETKAAPVAAARANRSSKYIENLLDKAQTRQREQDIVYERRQLKERKVEDHLFGDKEKFVTSAYKKKLQEQQLWQAEQNIRDAKDEEDAAEKRGNMDGFTQLTRNVAFGSSSKAAAIKQESAPISEKPRPAATSPSCQEAGEAASAVSAPAQEPSVPVSGQGVDGDQPNSHGAPGQATDAPPAVAASSSVKAAESAAAVVKASVGKRTDDNAAAAARERYLARKRKASGNPLSVS